MTDEQQPARNGEWLGYTHDEAISYARLVIREADANRFDAPKTTMLAREVVRLNEWADSMSDIALRERATADALIKELRAKLASTASETQQTQHEALVYFVAHALHAGLFDDHPVKGRVKTWVLGNIESMRDGVTIEQVVEGLLAASPQTAKPE